MNQFSTFLTEIENSNYPTNTTSAGSITIQQSIRNELREKGIEALIADLKLLYPDFDIVRTKEGIVIVAENPDFTFSWELKNTIKSIDFDPFLEANTFDELTAEKKNKAIFKEKQLKLKEEAIQRKRAQKLEQINRKRHLTTD